MINKSVWLLGIPVLITVIYISFYIGYSLKEKELQESANEIATKCPRLTGYAIDLETENARINAILNDCEVE